MSWSSRPLSRPRSWSVATHVASGWAWLVAPACLEPDERPSAWSYVHASIVAPACATAGCHSTLAVQAGLDLATMNLAYAELTGARCGEPLAPGAQGAAFVFAGDPARSKLLWLLRGQQVARMPPDTPLPSSEIALVERWIWDGAACD